MSLLRKYKISLITGIPLSLSGIEKDIVDEVVDTVLNLTSYQYITKHNTKSRIIFYFNRIDKLIFTYDIQDKLVYTKSSLFKKLTSDEHNEEYWDDISAFAIWHIQTTLNISIERSIFSTNYDVIEDFEDIEHKFKHLKENFIRI